MLESIITLPTVTTATITTSISPKFHFQANDVAVSNEYDEYVFDTLIESKS